MYNLKVICHFWYKCQPWTLVCRNLISWWMCWHVSLNPLAHEVIHVAQVISLISEGACVRACQEENQESSPACSPWRHDSKSSRSEITLPAGTFNKKVLIKDKCLCWTCLQGAGQSIRLTTSHLLTNDFHTCVGGDKPIDLCWRSALNPFNFILKKTPRISRFKSNQAGT